MGLVSYYKQNTYRFLTRKHQCSKKSEYLRKAKVIAFLEYCEKKGITDIYTISNKDKEEFLKTLDRSAATKKLYEYAIDEFFRKAKIDQ